MYTSIFRPAETGFGLLRLIGTLANIAALLVLLAAVGGALKAAFFSAGPGLQLGATTYLLFGLVYTPMLLLLAQGLHWMAAMYELRLEANRLLRDRAG